MPFRVRYLSHDFELPEGAFLIGRSGDCQLSLDDPLVSRRHASLAVRSNVVIVHDHDSRNGVYVNGVRIARERELVDGDRITIGSQELVIYTSEDETSEGFSPDFRRSTQTLGAAVLGEVRKISDDPTELASLTDGGSRGFQSLRLLTNLADKALALGRADEAERILQTMLIDILSRARQNVPLDMQAAEIAARYAAKLAGATSKGSWINYVFELYVIAHRPLPAPVVDELYIVVRKVKTIDLHPIRSYLEDLRRQIASFGPADRFLMQRIEGLERLVSLK